MPTYPTVDQSKARLHLHGCHALDRGHRGLPGGDSLPRLLARRRGARLAQPAPKLTEAKVVRWAKAHRQRTGDWPHAHSGPVPEEPGLTWGAASAV